MGLDKGRLEWHSQQCRHTGRMGWVVRVAFPYNINPARVKYRRYAHVDILPDWVQRVKDKHYVELINTWHGSTEQSWHNSVEEAKMFVEAIFALED